MGLGSLFGGSGGEKAAKEAVKIQREKLEIARKQAKLFQPLFEQFSNFFTNVTVEDIARGNIISPLTAATVADIKQSSASQVSQFEDSASRDGIPDSAAEIIRQNLLTTARRDVNLAQAAGRERELDRRRSFLNLGVEANRAEGSAADSLSSSLFNLSNLQEQQEQQTLQTLGDIGASAAFLATTGVPKPPSSLTSGRSVRSPSQTRNQFNLSRLEKQNLLRGDLT